MKKILYNERLIGSLPIILTLFISVKYAYIFKKRFTGFIMGKLIKLRSIPNVLL